MPKKDLDALLDRDAMRRRLIDALPLNEEAKNNLCGVAKVLDEIEEAHKNELWGARRYAVIRGARVLEGHPTEIGYADKQKVPAIFNVRIVKGKSNKKPVFLAYSTTAGCVAEGSTWKRALKAMHAEIIRTLELKNEPVPRPIIMEVAECAAGGDLFFYQGIKRSQERWEPLYREMKEFRAELQQMEASFKRPENRLIDWEE